MTAGDNTNPRWETEIAMDSMLLCVEARAADLFNIQLGASEKR